MNFDKFRISVTIRIFLILAMCFTISWLYFTDQHVYLLVFTDVILIIQVIELISKVEGNTHRFVGFLESIRYADFSLTFPESKNLGKSTLELNKSLNAVMDAFKKVRADSEESLNFINTLVQHINVGIISFDQHGQINLLNSAARNLLSIVSIANVRDLEPINPPVFKIFMELPVGQKTIVKINNEKHLSIAITELRQRGRVFRLVSLQNIRSELQTKETEAWQNLTRVLRHEIMNSITPIASLTSTLKDIIEMELQEHGDGHAQMSNETIDDITQGLNTIERRSKGLVKFINAYRDYTNLPQPDFRLLRICDLLKRIESLVRPEMEKSGVDFEIEPCPSSLEVMADHEMIEMVILNLLKNAREAVIGNAKNPPTVKLKAGFDGDLRVCLFIIDNGPGILPSALERIFIPFFTTKKEGTGIGLALCRQIMQLHTGSLTVSSAVDEETTFTVKF